MRLKWAGDGTYTDSASSQTFRPATKHDLPDDQAEEYLDHDLFGDRWERVDDGDDGDDGGGDATSDEATGDEDPADNSGDRDLADLDGVGEAKADALREAGYETLNDLRDVSDEDLASEEGISESLAERIKSDLASE